MKRTISLCAVAAATMLAAQPCLAADDIRELGMVEHRSAMFAGANVRLGFGGPQRQAPAARLQVGMTHIYQDRRSASPATVYRLSGFELGASRRGAPSLSIGRADVREFERRLGLSTGGAIAIGAGAVVAVLAIAFAAGGETVPDDFLDE